MYQVYVLLSSSNHQNIRHCFRPARVKRSPESLLNELRQSAGGIRAQSYSTVCRRHSRQPVSVFNKATTNIREVCICSTLHRRIFGPQQIAHWHQCAYPHAALPPEAVFGRYPPGRIPATLRVPTPRGSDPFWWRENEKLIERTSFCFFFACQFIIIET